MMIPGRTTHRQVRLLRPVGRTNLKLSPSRSVVLEEDFLQCENENTVSPNSRRTFINDKPQEARFSPGTLQTESSLSQLQ